MSNLSCIGLPTDPSEFESLFNEARPDGTSGDPAHHLTWSDPSGARLAIHLDRSRRRVECFTPFFIPETWPEPWAVRATSCRDDQCAHCGGLDVDIMDRGEMITRATVQMAFFRSLERAFRRERDIRLRVVGMAHEASFFDSEEAFRRATTFGSGDEKIAYATESFVPIGHFNVEGGVTSRAKALFGGRVVEAEVRVNSKTLLPFIRARIRTLPGQLDVLVGGAALPAVGTYAWLTAWLVGIPADPVPGGLFARWH